VLTLVTIHNHTTFGFKLPCTLVHVEDNHVHTEVTGSLLCTQTGTETIIEENQQASLVLTQRFILIAVLLDFERFLQGGIQVAQVKYISVVSHILSNFIISHTFDSQR
jgi:predicted nucleic-acid-binding protein